MFRVRLRWMMVACIVACFYWFGGAISAEAQSDPLPVPGPCGLTSLSDQTVIVEFGLMEGQHIAANPNRFETPLITVDIDGNPLAIPAGTYDVTFVSFDYHTTHEIDPLQDQEQWFVRGWHNGEELGRSASSPDLAEDINWASWDVDENGVNAEVTFTNVVSAVSAKHKLDYRDPDFHSVSHANRNHNGHRDRDDNRHADKFRDANGDPYRDRYPNRADDAHSDARLDHAHADLHPNAPKTNQDAPGADLPALQSRTRPKRHHRRHRSRSFRSARSGRPAARDVGRSGGLG